MNKTVLTRIIVILLAAAMLLSILLPAVSVFAGATVTQDDIDDLKDDIEAIEERRRAIEEEQAKLTGDKEDAQQSMELAQEQVLLTEQQISSIQSLIDAIQREIDATQQEIDATQRDIDATQRDIDASQAELDRLDADIAQKESDIRDLEQQEADQYQEFYAQVRWMEETGPVSYLSVLFEASSFSEMLDYVMLISDIMDYSNRIITRLEQTQAELAEARSALQDTRNAQALAQQEMEAQKAELERERALQEEQKARQEAQKAEQEDQKAALNAQKAKWERDKAAALALLNRIAASQSAYAEEARRLAQQEAELQQALKNAETLYAQQLANLSNDGPWYWPLPGRYGITSLFGGRYSPITGKWESHTGTDVGDAPSGTEIYAAQDGIVTLVGTNRYASYGYYCIITHANGFATLYAHQSRIPLVKEGEMVKKGQLIGYVGSTGSSTAPHLHFELRINGVRADVLQLYPNTTFHGYGGRTWKGNNYPEDLRRVS